MKNYALKFEQLIESEPDYQLLSEYVRSDKKVKIKHLTCDTIYFVRPNSFKKGQRCSKCANEKSKEKAKREFEQLIESEPDYQLLSKYIESCKKVKIKHLTCNTVYSVAPRSFKIGQRCPKCAIEKTAYDYYKNRLVYIYYIKMENQYKIGITKKGKYKIAENAILKARYKNEVNKGINIEIIDYKLFEDGYEAYKLEQKIISNFQDKLINKKDMILESGHTETFIENILGDFKVI